MQRSDDATSDAIASQFQNFYKGTLLSRLNDQFFLASPDSLGTQQPPRHKNSAHDPVPPERREAVPRHEGHEPADT